VGHNHENLQYRFNGTRLWPRLLWWTNRKSHRRCRLVPKSMTLYDIERPKRIVAEKKFYWARQNKKGVLSQEEPRGAAVNFDTHLSCIYQQPFKCRNYTQHADFHSRDAKLQSRRTTKITVTLEDNHVFTTTMTFTEILVVCRDFRLSPWLTNRPTV